MYKAANFSLHCNYASVLNLGVIMAINLNKPFGQFDIQCHYINISDFGGAYYTDDLLSLAPSDVLAIQVVGREWHDKVYGNSYNDFTIIFALKDGLENVSIFGEIVYGYGSYYEQRARAIIKTLGLFNLATTPVFYTKKENCKRNDLYSSEYLKSMGAKDLYKDLCLFGYTPTQEI